MHIKVRSVIINFFRFLLALVIAVVCCGFFESSYRPTLDGCGFVPPPFSWCYPGYQITMGFIFGFVLFLLSPKVKLAYIACIFFILLFGSLESLLSIHQLDLLGPTTLFGVWGALLVFVSFTIFRKVSGKNNA